MDEYINFQVTQQMTPKMIDSNRMIDQWNDVENLNLHRLRTSSDLYIMNDDGCKRENGGRLERKSLFAKTSLDLEINVFVTAGLGSRPLPPAPTRRH